MTKRLMMIVLFYLINFAAWDYLVDNQYVSPAWASIIVYTLLFFVCLGLYGFHLRKEWGRFSKNIESWKNFLLKLVVCSLLGVAATGLSFYITMLLVDQSTGPSNQENISNVVSTVPPLASLLMITFFGPVIEELTFRESFIGQFSKANKAAVAAASLVSIILFDAIHIIELYEFWYYLPMAVLLTFFYLWFDRNIWSSILFHSFYNLGGYLILVLSSFFALQ